MRKLSVPYTIASSIVLVRPAASIAAMSVVKSPASIATSSMVVVGAGKSASGTGSGVFISTPPQAVRAKQAKTRLPNLLIKCMSATLNFEIDQECVEPVRADHSGLMVRKNRFFYLSYFLNAKFPNYDAMNREFGFKRV
tara:strand:- start:90 stop:506 length:417 start_codon:yes stop_codon:yes gene_type:complete